MSFNLNSSRPLANKLLACAVMGTLTAVLATTPAHAAEIEVSCENTSSDTAFSASDTITYITHSLDGDNVNRDTVTNDNYKPIPDNELLTEGVYFVDRDVTYDKQVVTEGNVTIVLGNDHTMTCKNGIFVKRTGADEGRLDICAEPNGNGRLVSESKYDKHGPCGAGIGGDMAHLGGEIAIHGGTVVAKGADGCAGIGGTPATNKYEEPITIFDGDVTATGGIGGAGIGSGRDSAPCHIAIYNGEVNANGGDQAAGIGCGSGEGSVGGSVAIIDGKVNARSGNLGAGIGSGYQNGASSKNRCAKIVISGGTVEAYANKNVDGNINEDGAGIGGGSDVNGGDIQISAGNIRAVGSNDGAGIGGGDGGDSGIITISGGDMIDACGVNGAGIGGGQHCGNVGMITITGGDISARSDYGAGIGGGKGYDDHGVFRTAEESGMITMTGGKAVCTSNHAFGIGGGFNDPSDCADTSVKLCCIGAMGTINIGGHANVVANGARAGLGGKNGTISINGMAQVEAKGKDWKGKSFELWGDDAHLSIQDATMVAGKDNRSTTEIPEDKHEKACVDKTYHYVKITCHNEEQAAEL